MATATGSSSFYGNRQFINVLNTANILLSRVETPSAANAAILNRVYIDEYSVNVAANTVSQASWVQTTILPWGEKSGECSTTSQCLTLPNSGATMGASNVPVAGSKNFLDEKLGQLTLSQDRCWITMAGVNARAGTVPGYPSTSKGPAFSFVAIPNINSLYWQANDGTVDALKSSLTSETAFSASIPRAVALGRSAADDFSTVIGGSNPFIDVLYYATGVTAAPSFHGLIWSSNFNNPSPAVQPTKFPFVLDPSNFVGTTGMCYAIDNSFQSAPSFYQHLLTVSALSQGAIRYWGDYDRKANDPVIQMRTQYTETNACVAGSTCKTTYGRCGITPTTTVPPAFESYVCYDNFNNPLACDVGADYNLASITFNGISYTSNCVSFETLNGVFYSSTYCGSYYGIPAARQVPKCPYNSVLSNYNSVTKQISYIYNSVTTTQTYLGQLDSSNKPTCFTKSSDEKLCQSPVTATATQVPDKCYQVYASTSTMDEPVMLLNGNVPQNSAPVYCQLFDSSVGGAQTNPSWLPPQSSFSCTSSSYDTKCAGVAGSYTFPAPSSGSGSFYAGVSYKCVPCWGAFDSRVIPSGQTVTRRGVDVTDAVTSLAISMAYGYTGTSGQKLGNCASFMKGSASGASSSVVFWVETDATAAVRRGDWQGSSWTSSESIWPTTMSTTHILGVAYSIVTSIPSLYAISTTTLFVSGNPLDAASLVRWSTLTTPSVSGSTFHGISLAPRYCAPPVATFSGSSSVSVSYTVSVTNCATTTPSASSSAIMTETSSASASTTGSVTPSYSVSVSVTHSVSTTITPSATASLAPRPFTRGNVLVSRVENMAGYSLNRVWIDEYYWNSATPATAATRVQSIHFPHRQMVDSTSSSLIDTTRLTLPFDLSRNESLGQLTISMDRCAVGIAGFDVGVDEFNSVANSGTACSAVSSDCYSYTNEFGVTAYRKKLFKDDGSIPSTSGWVGSTTRSSGYRLSVARISARGWSDYFDLTFQLKTKYQHWLPKFGGRYLTTLSTGVAQDPNFYASDVYINHLLDAPRAVALTSVGVSSFSLRTEHANELFYVTGHSSSTSSNQWSASGGGGSIRGRCWKGAFDYAANYPTAVTGGYYLKCGDYSQSTQVAGTTGTYNQCNGAGMSSTSYSSAAQSSWSSTASINCLKPSTHLFPVTALTSLTTDYDTASCGYSFQYMAGTQCAAAYASNKAGCQCSSTDYVTVDRANTVGTAGLCFVGPATSATNGELRLLTVRKTTSGAIYGWPSGVTSTSGDQSYVPSLSIADYGQNADGTFTYAQKQLSALSNSASGTNNFAGVSKTSTPSNFRNCAAKTAADLSFSSTSNTYVFWAEYFAPDGYAIARSDFSSGSFAAPVPIWKQGVTFTSSSVVTDNAIVGIAFFDDGGSNSDTKDILYAASLTKLYATLTHYAPALSGVTWYELVEIGKGEAASFGGNTGKVVYGTLFQGSEHRGISMAPLSTCNDQNTVYRELAEEVEGEKVEESAN